MVSTKTLVVMIVVSVLLLAGSIALNMTLDDSDNFNLNQQEEVVGNSQGTISLVINPTSNVNENG